MKDSHFLRFPIIIRRDGGGEENSWNEAEKEKERERTAKRKYWPSLEGVRRTNFLLNNTYLFSRVPPLSDSVLWQKEPRLSLVDIIESMSGTTRPCLVKYLWFISRIIFDSLTFNLIRFHLLVLSCFSYARCFLNFNILSNFFSFFFVKIIVTNFHSKIVFLIGIDKYRIYTEI